MTTRAPRSPTRRLSRARATALSTVISLVAIAALAAAVLAGGTTIVVTSIPGGGWIQSIDNTAGGSAQLVPFAEPGTLGNGSLQLTTAATTDFAGVLHPLAIPYSSLVGASWRTFVTTAVATDAASLRLAGYQTPGFSDFTTLSVELVYNGGVLPDSWQDAVLDGETVVWQTNDDDGFCTNSTFCTFDEFKAEYPTGRFTFIQVAIGTGVPAATSYADGVSLTILEGEVETTETFDFDIVAAPTPIPTVAPPDPAPAAPAATPGASAGTGDGGLPDTRSDMPSVLPDPALGIGLGALVLLSAGTIEVVRRRRLSR